MHETAGARSGTADKLVPIAGPRLYSQRMSDLGMTHRFLEHENDDHATIVREATMSSLFEFLLAHSLPPSVCPLAPLDKPGPQTCR